MRPAVGDGKWTRQDDGIGVGDAMQEAAAAIGAASAGPSRRWWTSRVLGIGRAWCMRSPVTIARLTLRADVDAAVAGVVMAGGR